MLTPFKHQLQSASEHFASLIAAMDVEAMTRAVDAAEVAHEAGHIDKRPMLALLERQVAAELFTQMSPNIKFGERVTTILIGTWKKWVIINNPQKKIPF